MDIRTRRSYEIENEDYSILKSIEKKYGFKIVIEEGRRVDKYEAKQSERELYRSECFKAVKMPLKHQINIRLWYYTAQLKISRKKAILRLCNDFFRGENTIEQYLLGGERIRECVDNRIGLDRQMPLFDWSIKEEQELYAVEVYTKEERARKREEAILLYYYFYRYLLAYSEVDSEYVVCYRDFDISPKQLDKILTRNQGYLAALIESAPEVDELRAMFPMYAWDCSVAFNDRGDLPDDCNYLIESLKVYK